MSDLIGTVQRLRRPRLMIHAAKLGLGAYQRERDLKRLLGPGTSENPEVTLPALIAAEAKAEQIRKSGEGSYNFASHVGLLIALIAEARLCCAGHSA